MVDNNYLDTQNTKPELWEKYLSIPNTLKSEVEGILVTFVTCNHCNEYQ